LGVCGGFGEYFNTDPVIIRVITVLIAFVTGFFPALIAYLIIALIVPVEGSSAGNPRDTFRENVSDMRDSSNRLGEDIRSAFENKSSPTGTNGGTQPVTTPPSRASSNTGMIILGLILVAIGVFFILINVFHVWGYLWPVFLIIAGVIVIVIVVSRRR
jgi:phage shock protein C